MSSLSPHQQSLGLTDSPMSSLSSPSSPSFPDGFTTSSNRNPQTTVYDILHSADNPSDLFSEHREQQSLVTAGCVHLAQAKKQRRRAMEDEVVIDDDDRCDLFSSYQSLVRYSLAWHKSRRQLSTGTTSDRKRKQYKEVKKGGSIGGWIRGLTHRTASTSSMRNMSRPTSPLAYLSSLYLHGVLAQGSYAGSYEGEKTQVR